MNINMEIPGLKGVMIDKIEQLEERIVLHVSMPKQEHSCPSCGLKTAKVHDYRTRKVKHLKWFERLTTMFYKRRRYVCACGKRFSEKNPFVERYQRFSKEANQVMRIRSVKANTFKEATETISTSSSTVIRRFKTLVQELPSGVQLPRAIAIDEYKADTDAGKYQLIIADADTHQPIDILPNRRKDTIHDYLRQYGAHVEIVVMDMKPSFKAAVKKALDRPVIVADRFHYCRYIHWAVDEVRRKVKKWQREAKVARDMTEVKLGLEAFYREVELTKNPAFLKAIKTFKNWQVEILNSYAFGYSNGFLEGINNTSKVFKRNAYGFRKYEHFKAKVLLSRVYKHIGVHIG